MRKLVLLSIAALFVSISVQAHNVIINKQNIAQESLYNSIYNDFEQFYKDKIKNDSSEEDEQDALYNDLYNAFESANKRELTALEYQEEREDALYMDLSENFNKYYTLSTIAEEYNDNINDYLYNSIHYGLERHNSRIAYNTKKAVRMIVSINR